MQDVLKQLAIEKMNRGSNALGQQSTSYDIKAINPRNGACLACVSSATIQEYESIVEEAQAEFLRWREIPAPQRAGYIRQIAQILRAKKQSLGALIALEVGKTQQEGEGEVQEMIDMADFAIGLSRMLYGLTMPSERAQHRIMEQWHPLGVVGVISAFNFPMAVWSWNAFIAAVCGNTIVWKPSDKAVLCAIAIQNICDEVMNKAGFRSVFNFCVSQTHNLGEALAKDKRIPLVSFTGSTKVGYKVSEQIAKRMGRSILELGGNNAVIVDESANLKLAIPAIVFGAVGTAGQRCTSTRRVFVCESRFEEVAQSLKEAYAQITPEWMGPLIDAQAVEYYREAIEALKQQGAEIIAGGNVKEGLGFFVEPTIVIAQNNWPIVQKETFAPILYLIKYNSFEEALMWHNDVPQGLSSSLFTDSVRHAEYFLSAKGSDCGIANINVGTSGAEIGAAFGGEKETGQGREAGSDAWKLYMRRQTNTINWGETLPLSQGIVFDWSER